MFLSTQQYEIEQMSVGERDTLAGQAASCASERRTAPRVMVSLEAVWEGMSGKYEARVSDISLSGCFLETIGQASAGEAVRFRIKTPTGRWLQLGGEVIYSQFMLGFGLRFTEVCAEDRAMLRQLIEFYS
ncbi:MAG: PilZ domain-containing protein [Acidobacteriota bacterium]|nr:PilZ domain-containing protein [Acidobacteriota bacterium]